jgi:hypothetical protein
MELDKENIIPGIKIIINYLWDDECRHYHELDCPDEHIFLTLKKLQNALDIPIG